MKIYLVLEYIKQGTNVWAEVQAFTSPREQQKGLKQVALKPGADYEGMEVEVKKRAYAKPEGTPYVITAKFDTETRREIAGTINEQSA